jgi:hypothetical protein
VDGARYRGSWDGVREDSAVWLASVAPDVVDAVRSALASLADAYRQDAIGLVIGTPELATP